MKTRFSFCSVLPIVSCVNIYEDIPVMSPFEEEYIHTYITIHVHRQKLLFSAHVCQTELFGHREKMEHWGICPPPPPLKISDLTQQVK
jgi:hypothetical protein